MLPPSWLHQSCPRSHWKETFESLMSNQPCGWSHFNFTIGLAFTLVLVMVPNHIADWGYPNLHSKSSSTALLSSMLPGTEALSKPNLWVSDSGWHPHAWAYCLNLDVCCLWSPTLTLPRNNFNQIFLWCIPLLCQHRWLLWKGLYAIT